MRTLVPCLYLKKIYFSAIIATMLVLENRDCSGKSKTPNE